MRPGSISFFMLVLSCGYAFLFPIIHMFVTYFSLLILILGVVHTLLLLLYKIIQELFWYLYLYTCTLGVKNSITLSS